MAHNIITQPTIVTITLILRTFHFGNASNVKELTGKINASTTSIIIPYPQT